MLRVLPRLEDHNFGSAGNGRVPVENACLITSRPRVD